MLKKDNLRLGIVLGIFAPLIGFIIYYFVKFYPLNFSDYLEALRLYKSLVTLVVSLSLLANAVLFTIYINLHKDQTAKGIFIVTVVYGIAALLFRMVG